MKKLYKFPRTLMVSAILFLVSVMAFAQDRMISGTITDKEGNAPIPGVNVSVKGTTYGTVTDVDGKFSLSVTPDAILVFSFVGYKSTEVAVGSSNVIDVTLESESTLLQETVVIGYGTVRKSDATGSLAVINSNDFNKGVTLSPQDLLVGKLAGVQVTSNSGEPGSGSTIRIRGGSSMSASNDPLIIIDGVPVDNAGIRGSPNALASINPNDIESFTVLKDASSTAIYGSRASNGVIIVTTKSGKPGRLVLNYNGNFSSSSPTKYIDVLSADEFRTLANDLEQAGSVGLNPKALTRLGNSNTDWQKEIYQNAFSQDHNINVSGSIPNMPYRVSYGFTDQNGILKTTGMLRHTINVSLVPTLLDDHLKINANLKSSLSENNFGNTGAIGSAVAFDPTQAITNGNTRFGGYFTWVNLSDTLADGSMNPNGAPNTFSINNPVALLNLTDNTSRVNRTIANIVLDYKFHFLPDLRVNINTGIDYSHGKGHNNSAPEAPWTYRNYTTENGELIDYEGNNKSELFDLYFNYVKNLGKNRIDLTAGYSYQHFKRDGWTFQRSEYEAGDSAQVRLSKEESTFANENFLVSFFGRLNYTFNNKYLITATLRDDGSSRFSEENRWGLFPAFALAWNVAEESFLSGSKVISDLKLRLGYGVTGQQDILNNYYPYLPVYRQSIGGASYQFGNTYYNTLRPDPYDANIKWEETTTYNIGLDFGFLNDRITGAVDVYKRNTQDLINFIPIPAGSNFSNFLTTNVGDLENKGFEITLDAKAISTPDLNWSIGVNFTKNTNEITKLTKTDDPNYPGVDVGGISGGVGNFIQNNKVGYPANSFYVFEQVYGQDGIPIEGLYVDRTGNGGAVISNNLNKYHYHSPAPDYLMGINSSLVIKNFDISFSGRLSLGNYVYNNVFSGTTYSSVYVQSGFFGNVLSAIDETRFTNTQYWSDHYVEDASFFKMDYISAGYNLNNLGDRLKARLSLTVQNAFTITQYSGLDPEVAGGIDNNIYPRPRVFMLGVSLTY